MSAPAARLAALVLVATVAMAAVVVRVARADDRPIARGPGAITVDLRLANSRFHPSRLEVVAGTTVRFRIHNEDPIGHEFIVGDAAVHARHERGREAAHPPVAGEVSLSPLGRGTTTFAFDEPGTLVLACHLPGHLAYGMRGQVVVRPAG